MNKRNEEVINNYNELANNPESVSHIDAKGHIYYETNRKIYATMDYDLFKKLQGNRTVEQKRIVKIIHSLETIGWMPAVVIVNEKFEIIDGQGRLESLKALNLPVEFVICEGSTIEECTVMNINSTNWTLTDYVYRFAEDDNSANSSSYKKLVKLMELYPRFSTGLLGCALKGVAFDGRTIKENKVYITDEMYEKAIPQLDYVSDILDSIKIVIPNHGGIKTFLLTAIIFCYNLPEIDLQRLKTSIVNSVNLPDAVWMDVFTAVQFIQKYYNKGLTAAKKIYMDTEYQKALDIRRSESAKLGIRRRKEMMGENEELNQEEEI